MPTRRALKPSIAAAASVAVLALVSAIDVAPSLSVSPVVLAATGPRLILPPSHRLRGLWMTSLHDGWALGSGGHLYYTRDAGHTWTKLGQFPGSTFSVGDNGRLAWGTIVHHTAHPTITVTAVSPSGSVWQHSVTLPGKFLESAVNPGLASPLAGLVLTERVTPSQLAQQVWAFDARTRRALLAYRANPLPDTSSPLTAVSVENTNHIWGTSVSPGPGPAVWSISSGRAAALQLTIPPGIVHGPVGPAQPGPIEGPLLFHGTGILAAEYQTISLRNQSQIAAAILYRQQGSRWTAVWHRGGYVESVDFVASQQGWIQWIPRVGFANELLRTTNGGHSFTRVASPGPGLPYFFSATSGWWIKLAPRPQIWETRDGGQHWVRVQTSGTV